VVVSLNVLIVQSCQERSRFLQVWLCYSFELFRYELLLLSLLNNLRLSLRGHDPETDFYVLSIFNDGSFIDPKVLLFRIRYLPLRQGLPRGLSCDGLGLIEDPFVLDAKFWATGFLIICFKPPPSMNLLLLILRLYRILLLVTISLLLLLLLLFLQLLLLVGLVLLSEIETEPHEDEDHHDE